MMKHEVFHMSYLETCMGYVVHMITKRSVLLLILLFFCCFFSCAMAEMTREDKTDRPGMDYATLYLDTPDPERCVESCANDDQCKAYTYVKPGVQGDKAHCWLKSGVPDPVSNKDCVSGVKKKPDLTGVWKSDQGGTYYITQLGNSIWWFGELSGSNPAWTNVAKGEIDVSKINLEWADVPKGSVMSHGNLVLKVDSQNKLTRISETGGFGCSSWTKKT
jgi:hypothetical protein